MSAEDTTNPPESVVDPIPVGTVPGTPSLDLPPTPPPEPGDPLFTIKVTQDMVDHWANIVPGVASVVRKYWPYILLIASMFTVGGAAGTHLMTPKTPDPAPIVDPVIAKLDTINDNMTGMRKEQQAGFAAVLAKPAPVPVPPGPTPPTPSDTPITFNGPSEFQVGGPPVDVQVLLGKGVTDLRLWAAPGTSSYVKVVGNVAIVAPPAIDGVVYLEATCLVDGKIADVVTWKIVAGKGPQPPPIPVPPVPVPPTPDAPIPLSGFRVLIVYDSAGITADQQGIVFGKQVRDYLQSHCVVGADGKTKDFWIIQSGSDVSAAPKWIGDVIQRHPGQKSFMVVSDGKTGSDGPLPTNITEAMAVLTKIGGQ